MSLVKDIELPEPEVMVQRAMAVTGCADEYLVSQMVQVVNDMADYCRKNSITDGACGMRSLIDWVISAEISGDPYLSAKYTVICVTAGMGADGSGRHCTKKRGLWASVLSGRRRFPRHGSGRTACRRDGHEPRVAGYGAACAGRD